MALDPHPKSTMQAYDTLRQAAKATPGMALLDPSNSTLLRKRCESNTTPSHPPDEKRSGSTLRSLESSTTLKTQHTVDTAMYKSQLALYHKARRQRSESTARIKAITAKARKRKFERENGVREEGEAKMKTSVVEGRVKSLEVDYFSTKKEMGY